MRLHFPDQDQVWPKATDFGGLGTQTWEIWGLIWGPGFLFCKRKVVYLRAQEELEGPP